jgi:hypothetical protein
MMSKESHNKRKKRRWKKPQRGASISGSVAHTDAGSFSFTPEPVLEQRISLSHNGALGLYSNNLIDLNSPPPGQNINGLMATLNIILLLP